MLCEDRQAEVLLEMGRGGLMESGEGAGYKIERKQAEALERGL